MLEYRDDYGNTLIDYILNLTKNSFVRGIVVRWCYIDGFVQLDL